MTKMTLNAPEIFEFDAAGTRTGSKRLKRAADALKSSSSMGAMPMNMPYRAHGMPDSQGLYNARNEHDACGVGFIANIKGRKSHDIVTQGLKILENLDHRGAVGA